MEVKHSSTLTPEQLEARGAREAQRGIVRDEQGHIVRTPEWLKARISILEVKKEDLKGRTKNIEAELADIKEKLK